MFLLATLSPCLHRVPSILILTSAPSRTIMVKNTLELLVKTAACSRSAQLCSRYLCRLTWRWYFGLLKVKSVTTSSHMRRRGSTYHCFDFRGMVSLGQCRDEMTAIRRQIKSKLRFTVARPCTHRRASCTNIRAQPTYRCCFCRSCRSHSLTNAAMPSYCLTGAASPFGGRGRCCLGCTL